MSVPDVCHDVIDLDESQGEVDNRILGFNTLFHFYNEHLLVFCCFFVCCRRAKRAVREEPIFGAGPQRTPPRIEEALVLPLLPVPWCPHIEK